MASFEERSGSVRAVVMLDGARKTATFPTRAEAEVWALGIEFKKRGMAKAEREARLQPLLNTEKVRLEAICACIQLDPNIKTQVEDALAAMGLSPSDALRLLLLQIVEEQRLPFEVRVPKPLTD